MIKSYSEILLNIGYKNKTGEFKSPSQSIGAIVRSYKIATIKRLKDYIKKAKESSFSNENPGESPFSKELLGEYSFSKESTGDLQFTHLKS